MQQTILTRDEQLKEDLKYSREQLKDAKRHEKKVRTDLRNGQLQLSVN